jgi:hypothetical protein
MAEMIENREFFHVTRDLPYSRHVPMTIGALIEAGSGQNPFFGFYEGVRSYPVKTSAAVFQVPAIRFVKSVFRKEIDCPNLPKIAAEIAEHYIILVRELVMEEMRREVAPDAPSRQSCLWLVDTIDEARAWRIRLGGNNRIVRLRARGNIQRAGAALLLGDSEPLSKTYDRARSYWKGEHSEVVSHSVV